MWAAKLVMENDPRWLKKFFLFENNKDGIAALKQLLEDQPEDPTRRIEIIPGDCNIELPRLLKAETIKPTEACFCLLDQRTFECRWTTLARLARCKPSGHKIELFYFLPHHWLHRALAGLTKNKSILQDWWGRDDWESLYDMTTEQIRAEFIRRFKTELGYVSVKAWPIYERRDGGATMYHMIHATDHLSAPKLMARAYKQAVFPKEPLDQLEMEWFQN